MLGISSPWGPVLSLPSVSMLEKVETPSCSADHTQLLRILVLGVFEEKSCFLYSLFLSSFQVSGKAVQRETVLLVTSFPLFQIRSGWSGNLEVYEGHTLIGQPYILSIFFNIETITSKTNFLVLLISTFCFSNSVNKFKYVFCQVSKIKIFPVLALILDS